MPAFHVDIDSGTAVVTLDVTGAPVNTLSSAVAQEFDGLLRAVSGEGGAVAGWVGANGQQAAGV